MFLIVPPRLHKTAFGGWGWGLGIPAVSGSPNKQLRGYEAQRLCCPHAMCSRSDSASSSARQLVWVSSLQLAGLPCRMPWQRVVRVLFPIPSTSWFAPFCAGGCPHRPSQAGPPPLGPAREGPPGATRRGGESQEFPAEVWADVSSGASRAARRDSRTAPPRESGAPCVSGRESAQRAAEQRRCDGIGRRRDERRAGPLPWPYGRSQPVAL